MKMNERYLWIAGIILAGFAVQSQMDNATTLKTLLQSYEVETNIQNAQINDFSTQASVIRVESYSEGFEAGKTQAGIALARGGSLYDYTEGYHAAIGQNIEEADVLQISEGMFNELTSLRKMVPRLLNQNSALQVRLDSMVDSNYAVEMLIETLDSAENVDETYLGIIDTLLESQGYPIPFDPTSPTRLHNKTIVQESKNED